MAQAGVASELAAYSVVRAAIVPEIRWVWLRHSAWRGTAFSEFTTIMHIIGTIGMERPAHTIYRILWIAPDQNDKFRFYPILFAFRHFWFPLIGKNLPHKKSKLSTESEQVGYFP